MTLLGEDGATVLGLEVAENEQSGDKLLVIIPARGGSQRLKRKNLLPVDGLPLFVHTAWSVLVGGPICDRLVVSTDDDEIASIAHARNLEVHRRPEVDPFQSIPDMAALVARDLEWEGSVLVVQPTVLPVPNLYPLLAQDEPTMLAMRGTHDIWLPGGSRVSRELADQLIGVYFWPAGSIIGIPPTAVWNVSGHYYDIDSPADYLIATRPRKTYTSIAADATTWNGTGHSRRQAELALHLQHYDVDEANPDLILLDIGNTSLDQIINLRTTYPMAKIVSFEDRGPGAAHADAVINALLSPLGLPHEYHGGDFALIRPEFLGLLHQDHGDYQWGMTTLLVVFGGTDAKDITSYVTSLFNEDYGIIHSPPFLGEAMMKADLLICGAGQIVQEAAYVGIPTIVIAATQREASHGHLGHEYGNIFLGLVAEVSEDSIRTTVNRVMSDSHLRNEMRARSRKSVDGKGAERILNIIEGLLI